MLRALELAEFGKGKVSPNPMVGCVIVHKDKITGEGWHRSFGSSHAEVNAINSVHDKSSLPNSTIYINLEPCAHIGKTPPCTDLIIEKKIKNIVLANLDPNPLVSGKGVEQLKAAGCIIQTGVLEDKGYELNKNYFTFHNKKRPFIILKWAETKDGFIARDPLHNTNFPMVAGVSTRDTGQVETPDSIVYRPGIRNATKDADRWISNKLSRMLVHKWRAEEDAIMIGTNTAKYDDPKLNIRHWSGKDPIRIVIDRNEKLAGSLNIFDEKQLTICYHSSSIIPASQDRQHIFYISIPDWKNLLKEILKDLYSRNIQSLLVEGGSKLLQSFIDRDLWDEIRLFKGNKTFGKGIRSPVFNTEYTEYGYETNLLDDWLMIYGKNKIDRPELSRIQ